MELRKIAGGARKQDERTFTFSDKTVQGAAIGKRGQDLFVRSPRRFKLYSDAKETIYVLEGNGFVKWKRGEIPFAAGDAFEADAPGEYELNGNCTFAVIRGEA